MELEDEIKVAKGFDRDIDYETMKEKLIKAYNKHEEELHNLDMDTKGYVFKRGIIVRKLMYVVIAMIQLRNGSRIIEAVKAFRKFLHEDNPLDKRVTVKLAKSATTKYNDDGETYVTEARAREMMFPHKWFELILRNDMRFFAESLKNAQLKKGTLDYLLANHNTNTHSLRYAFINYMLYVKKWEMGLIAKFIGHSSVNQLVRYTQNKNANKVFELDI
jgi:hypothetical protein